MSQNKVRDTRIVVCDRCEGEGCIIVATGDAEHCRRERCPQCGGLRVMKRVLTVEYSKIEEDLFLDKK